MKQGKKLAGLMLCLVLVIGCLSGCGGKSDETLLSSSVKTLNAAKNFDISSKMNGKMKVTMANVSQDVEMNVDMSGTQFIDPLKAKVTGSVSSAGTTISTETYVAKEGDKYVTYVKSGDEWSKISLGDLDQALAASGMNSLQNQLGEDASKYVKKDDIEENGTKYLVYDYTVSGDAIKDVMKSLTASMGSVFGTDEEGDEVEKMINDMMKEIGDITMTILIDRENECIYQIRYSAAEMMNKMMQSLIKSIGEMALKEAGEEEEETSAALESYLSTMKIEVSNMDVVIEYSNIDSAADFEIPKEALEAEEVKLDEKLGDAA